MSKHASTLFLTLTLCRGLPGSGKTTWAKEQVNRSLGSIVHCSRDDLRLSLHNTFVITGADKNKEEALLTKIQQDIVRNLLVAKKNVIIDDNNLSLRSIEGFYRLAQEFDGAVQIRFQDFEVPLKEIIRRNAEREKRGERFVSEKDLRDISKRHLNGGHELPVLPVKYYSRVERIEPLKQDDTLPFAWIVDIDGTIASISVDGRGPHDYDRVDEDEPVERALDMVRIFKNAGNEIIVVSGRSVSCEALTREWLEAFNVPFDRLIMRELDDSRSDHIIKDEIYAKHIENKYYVAGCMDDRKKVVDMWRLKGLFVAQVAPGLF